MNNFTHILYPTDFSEASQAAGDRAMQLAGQCGAKLTVLHVYASPSAVPDAWNLPDPRPQLEDALSKVATTDATLVVDRVLRIGTPAEGVVEYARGHDCDLIVMGTHGRTGLQHILMGSVAEKVIRTAPCPVMVVRLPASTKKVAKERESKHVVVV